MAQVETKFSLPGEWIDGRGNSRLRPAIHRIVVIKPDHIGDLLIADPAFQLLKRYFPEARLELICGTWNVRLAKRLKWFDAVHGVNLFHEVSGQQSDRIVAEEKRRDGVRALRDLALGSFDIAIDLRYDLDSRPLLRNIDSKVYAGFGRASDFPFLDVVLPMHENIPQEAREQVNFRGKDLTVFPPGAAFEGPRVSWGGSFASKRNELSLTFDIEGAITPHECGTEGDHRKLGVGLEKVTVMPVAADGSGIGAPVEVSPRFLSGWDAPEKWGSWSVADQAVIALKVPPVDGAKWYAIDLTAQAHVNSTNAEVAAVIRGENDGEQVRAEWNTGRARHTTPIFVSTDVGHVRLASPSFALTPGTYDGTVQLFFPKALTTAAVIEVALFTTKGHAEIHRHAISAKTGTRGIVTMPIQFKADVLGEDYFIQIDAPNPGALHGVRIERIQFAQEDFFKMRTPVSHMRDWASLLVLRTAQIFSDVAPFGSGGAGELSQLAVPPAEEEKPGYLVEIEQRLWDWKAEGNAIVGVALGCNSEIRKWPQPYWLELLDRIHAIEGAKLVLIGGPGDVEEALEVCAHLGIDDAVHSTCGKVGLDWLGVLLADLDLFVGNNTGTTHYAGKVGARTIGIYAGTNHPREWGPIGQNASWIYRDEPCAPCHLTLLQDCPNSHACMIDLMPDEVMAHVEPEVRAALSKRRRILSAA